ncbi:MULTISPECIES: NUDIX domain-containing protein [unclassified Leifsonia]|uniref:NUDIX domain-containing protein n=1 Tax=unclassified Leifsonia TaxID=2663824 RepID=UPI00070037EC|nr:MULTISPECIES: NUDIX hydrolase [unclassified Leifsonia]KQX06318.1 ADP-ribose pyrophosphatase [Leifsonia sp. Root1293]KRA10602.1 ADP-ribose pyrophosphatase [Leifsonia sp. Root60]
MPELSSGAGNGSSAPIADEPFHPEVTATTAAFSGMVWDVRRDTFDYNGEQITREYVDHTGAVGILAMDEDERVLLIRQYRHPVRHREWEIPAGLLDVAGEDPLVGAQRELSEEVDLAATEWAVLSDYQNSPGGSTEAVRVYLARGLSVVSSDFQREAEEADMEQRWVSLDDLVDAVLARRVQNSLLVVAALSAHAARTRDWAPLAPADAPWPRRPRKG